MSYISDHTKKGAISTSRINSVPNQPDNVYLDCLITNVIGENSEPVPINYTENRNNPVVDNAGDYSLSVVRFSLESQTLPVFIPTIQPNQGDANLTIYSVTLKVKPLTANKTYTSQQHIIWEAQDIHAQKPPPTSETASKYQANFNTYYYCYNFDWIAMLIQKALFKAQEDLENQLNADGVTNMFSDIYKPTVSFDPTTLSFILSANADTYRNNLEGSVIDKKLDACELYFNTPLYELLSTFPVQGYGTNKSITDGANFRINFFDNGTNYTSVPTIPNESFEPQTFIQVFQEFSTINNITPISGIVFTTSQIPIVPNQLSSPMLLREGESIQALSGNNSNFGLILTDLESGDLVYKPNLTYTPTGEYRRISLQSQSPVSNIQISVFWRNKLGELTPLTLASGASCTIKLLFTKTSAIYNR